MKEDKKVRNLLQIYLQWPLVLSILMLFANAAVLFFSSQAGIAMSVFTILYLICAGLLWWYGKKRLMSGLVAFGADYSWSQKQLLASMELPYGTRRRRSKKWSPGSPALNTSLQTPSWRLWY